jgi:FkbM family methyltransferase
MKALTKTILRKSIRSLPFRIRRFALEELARAQDLRGFAVAGDIARSVGIAGFVAEGACGSIRGALDDEAALATYARTGSWSPQEIAIFAQAFADCGGTYIDIGANIGLTVIPIAQIPQVECFAFEPEPHNFQYLSENVAVNCKSNNVRLFNLALFDKATSLPFEIAPRHSGDHRLSISDVPGRLGEHTRQKIVIAARPLDDVVGTDVKKPIAAKIDVQGAEPFVIAGGRNLLSRANLLSLEFWPYSIRRMKGDAAGLIAFLVEHFQEACLLARDEGERLTWQPIDAIAIFLHKYFEKNCDGENTYLNVLARKIA